MEQIFTESGLNKTKDIIYSKKQNSTLTLYEKFIETLSKEQIIMFEEVLDKLFKLNEELTKTEIQHGFKISFNIAVET